MNFEISRFDDDFGTRDFKIAGAYGGIVFDNQDFLGCGAHVETGGVVAAGKRISNTAPTTLGTWTRSPLI